VSGEFAELLGLLQASVATGGKGLNLFSGKNSRTLLSGDIAEQFGFSQQGRFSHLPGESKNTQQGNTRPGNGEFGGFIRSSIPGNLLSGQGDSLPLESASGKKAFFSEAPGDVNASGNKKKSIQLQSKQAISGDLKERTGLRPQANVANDAGKGGPGSQVRTGGGDSETARVVGARLGHVGKETARMEKQGSFALDTGGESKSGVSSANKGKEGIRFSTTSESQAGEKVMRGSGRQQPTQTTADRATAVYGASKTNAEVTRFEKGSQSKESRVANATRLRNSDSETIAEKETNAKSTEKPSSAEQLLSTKKQAGPAKSTHTGFLGSKAVENTVSGERAGKTAETWMAMDDRPVGPGSGGATGSDSAAAKNGKMFFPTGRYDTQKEEDKQSHVKSHSDVSAGMKNDTHVERESQNIRGEVQGPTTVNKSSETGFAKPGFSGTQLTGAEIFRQVQDQVEEMLAKFSWPATHRARLSLNPPSLGALDIEVEVRGDQVKTTFLTASPVVKEILDSGMETLRQSLNQAGMNQSETNVFLQQGNAEGRDSCKQSFGNKKKSGSVERAQRVESGGSDSKLKSLEADGTRLINVRV